MTTLEVALKRLHEARNLEARDKADLKAKREEFEATIAAEAEMLKEATAHREQCEAQVRELAVAAFQKDGNKQPHPGVSIAEQKKLHYTEADAFAWAREEAKHCLTIDKKAFEATAKAVMDKAPLPFVTVEVVPQAKIATDLSGVV